MIVHKPECSCYTCNPGGELDRLVKSALEDLGYEKGIMVEISTENLLPKVEE